MEIKFPSAFPSYTTSRLILREIDRTMDLQELYLLYSNEKIVRHRGVKPFSEINEASNLIKYYNNGFKSKKLIRWGLTLKSSNKLIGTCGFKNFSYNHFRGEIGYELKEDLWNMGLMTEALAPIIEMGFNIGLHSIEANIAPENLASEKVLQKLGFLKEAHFKENYFFKEKFWDSVIYSKIKS